MTGKDNGVPTASDVSPVSPVSPAPSRNDLRVAFFADVSDTPRRHPLTYKGVSFELEQPTVADAFIAPAAETSDAARRSTIFSLLIAKAYVPGTNEKVFDPQDYYTFMRIPFNKDVIKLVSDVQAILDIDIKERVGNSESEATTTSS